MWRFLTKEAQLAVWEANDEAKRFGQSSVKPVHLLSGLLRARQGTLVALLEAIDVSPAGLRNNLEALLEDGDSTVEHLSCSPQTKRALDLAFDEACAMGDPRYGTDHLLLGLLHEEQIEGESQFFQLGLDLLQIRETILLLRLKRDASSRAIE